MAKRLIDANALIKDIDKYYQTCIFPHPGTTWRRGLELAVELLLKAPTAEAVEVVHGRWEQGDYYDFGDVCSVCDYDSGIHDCKLNYCPHCGAKMDGGKEEW